MNKTSLLFGVHMHQPVDNFRLNLQSIRADGFLSKFKKSILVFLIYYAS